MHRIMVAFCAPDKCYSACGCSSARDFICSPAEVHDGMTIVIVSVTILSGIELDGIARINVVVNQPADLVCVPISDRIMRWAFHDLHKVRHSTCLTKHRGVPA